MRPTLGLLLGIGTLVALSVGATNWPQMRGPSLDGRSSATEVFADTIGFEQLWRVSLGSGYSHVAVAGGRAVTMFSDGESDLIAAFDAASGRELWRRALGPTYRGHDSSADGPLGTPTIDGERIYAVGPRGQLVALATEDGRLLWSRDLVAELKAQAPFFGFSATPLRVDSHLVVQTGGDQGAVTAFDPATGEVRWNAVDAQVDHSLPLLVEVDGTTQMLIIGATTVNAVRPSDGTILWSFRHPGKPSRGASPQAVLVGTDRFLLQLAFEAILYRIVDGKQTTTPEELWRSHGFDDTTAVPIFHDGYLYGFDRRFLTCVDAATGKTVWKSRSPGGHGLIYVDSHLLILGARGVLAAVEATPAGYREKAVEPLLDAGGHTAPTFADGRIFVRNLAQLAAVRVTTAASAPAPAVALAEEAREGTFAAFLRSVTTAEDKPSAIEAFLAEQQRLPLIEGDQAHILYYGPAQSVAVFGELMEDLVVPEAMQRVPGTDLFYRTYRLPRGTRWSYRLQIDDQDPEPDPRNPLRAIGTREPSSELTMPGFEDPEHVRPSDDVARRGRIGEVVIHSTTVEDELAIPVYLPAGFDDADALPLVVVASGEHWSEADLGNSLDHLVGTRVRPARFALVPFLKLYAAGWTGGANAGAAVRLIVEEVLPQLEKRYAVDGLALWTVEEKANMAVELAANHPGRFARIACQSPRTFRHVLPEFRGRARSAWLLSSSRHEPRSAERSWDLRREAMELRDWLREQGNEVAVGEQMVGGPGFRTWRQHLPEVLAFLVGEVNEPDA